MDQFGPYQRRVLFAVCLVAFSTAFNNLGFVFWAARPDYHCVPTKIRFHDNGSSDGSLNRTIPWEMDKEGRLRRSQCFQYAVDDGSDDETIELPDRRMRWNDSIRTWNYEGINASIVECKSWKYDTSLYKSTIVTEWNLVCSKSWLVSLTQSMYMAGRIVGTLIYGQLSDRYGRRKALMISVILQCICSFGCAWISNIYIFLFLRFLLGIQTTGEFQSAFVIATEMVGQSWRVFAGVLIQVYWSVAYMTIAGLAYLIRDRFCLQLALSLPLFLLILLYWVVPETPRWLLAHGKREECLAIMRKMAKKDSDCLKEPNEYFMANLMLEEQSDANKCSLLDLFRTPNIRRTSFVLLFSWFVNSFVFYGLSLASSSFGGNDYLNFFLSGLVEIPAHLVFFITFTRFGRPLPFSIAMIIAGLALISILLVPSGSTAMVLAFALIGKAAITCSYAMVYLYSSEVYPTVMRSTGVGMGALFARIGGVLSPQQVELSYLWQPLPSVIFGVLSLAAGTMALFLPETKNLPMPQTVSDGEELNRFSNSLICNRRCVSNQCCCCCCCGRSEDTNTDKTGSSCSAATVL